jgi:hypothetical protein
MNRRHFLSGSVTLPPLMGSVLAGIKAQASDKPNRPLRFVFFTKGNGLWADNVQPQGMNEQLPFKVEYDDKGRLVGGNNGNVRKAMTPPADMALAKGWKLNPLMESLAPFRDKMSILQGINSGFNVYHLGNYQTLGAFQGRNRNSTETLGQTIDSVLAQAIGGPIPHVCLGHEPKAASGVAYIPRSAAGVGKPIPFYTKPGRAYKELFGVVGEGAAKGEYDTHNEILDFFAEDAKRLKGEVAADERQQLDRYLGAFDSVRESRRKIEAMSEQLRKHAPPVPGEIEAHSTSKIAAANIDIAIASLVSGLTNVVTMCFDTLGSSSYPEFGIGGLHGAVGHGQGGKVLEKRQTICRFHYEQVAKLAGALEAMPEGDGTMLDNTVIIYTSDNGETHHSSGVNYPMVVLGDLGGRLNVSRYFAPGNDREDKAERGFVRLGDVWSTLLAAAGQPFKEFGIPRNGEAHRPIESLLA